MTHVVSSLVTRKRVSPSCQRHPAPAHWFPAAPAVKALKDLAKARGLAVTELARQLGIDRRTIQRLARREVLRADAADHIAVALGRHPCELWSTWFDPTTPHHREAAK
jgi:lambda repressor-like predicted transcriptional regulator